MIITCPACSSQYVLPDNAIGAKGRRVKCTSCEYTWLQAPETPAESLEKPVFSVPEYNPDNASQDSFVAAPRKKAIQTPVVKTTSGFSTVILKGFALGIFLLLLTFGTAVLMRTGVVANAPASALLFEKIGLPVAAPAKGLAFDDVKTLITQSKGKDVLNVSGKLSNNTRNDIFLPKLIIRLSSATGWLKDWPVNLRGKSLPSGKTTNFTYDLLDMPSNGQSVTLLFAD